MEKKNPIKNLPQKKTYNISSTPPPEFDLHVYFLLNLIPVVYVSYVLLYYCI